MATGHFTRRRPRPGYLVCGDPMGLHDERTNPAEKPEEEFRLLRRVYGGRERFYRNSYCDACMSAYNTRHEKARARTDPAYHESRKRQGRASYRRNAGAARRSDREYRVEQAGKAIARLNGAGWSCNRIGLELGIKPCSLVKWRSGQGCPREAHLASLRSLVNTVEANA